MNLHSDLHMLEPNTFLQMRQRMIWVHMQLQVKKQGIFLFSETSKELENFN